jgi:hypothetical protein
MNKIIISLILSLIVLKSINKNIVNEHSIYLLHSFLQYFHYLINDKEVINNHNNIFDRKIKIALEENYYGNSNSLSSYFYAKLYIKKDILQKKFLYFNNLYNLLELL